MDKINGIKTYLVSAIAFLCYLAFYLQMITWEQFIQIIPLLGIGGLMSFRSAIKKIE